MAEKIPVTGKAKDRLTALLAEKARVDGVLNTYTQALLDSNEAEGTWKFDLATFEFVKEEETSKAETPKT